jgi:hypothetical protein
MEAIVIKASMALLAFSLAIVSSACAGAPQYGLTPSEVDSGIFVADRPGPDAVVPVLDLDAGPTAVVQTSGRARALPQPVVTGVH